MKAAARVSPHRRLCFMPRPVLPVMGIIIITIINNVLISVTLSHKRCRSTLQSHNNSEEGSKKLAKTEPKQTCLRLLPKGGEG